MSSIESGGTSAGSASQSHGTAGSKGSRSSRSERALCAFWVGERCFGLDIGLASEVVEVEGVAEVPLSPPEIVGIFNLRGSPVPIVDLSSALGAGEVRGAARVALVLRTETMVFALSIDRMDGVVAKGRGTTVQAGDQGESPLVEGFVEVPGRSGVITALSVPALLEHIDRLRFARPDSDGHG